MRSSVPVIRPVGRLLHCVPGSPYGAGLPQNVPMGVCGTQIPKGSQLLFVRTFRGGRKVSPQGGPKRRLQKCSWLVAAGGLPLQAALFGLWLLEQ